MPCFIREKLLPGMIIRRRGTAAFSRLIIRTLGSWASHDAIAIYINGVWYVGDAESPFAHLTPLEVYEQELLERNNVQVAWVCDATPQQGVAAANYWLQHVQGSPYDWFAFPRLLLKEKLLDFSESKVKWIKWLGDRYCGFTWAHWCTEGVAEAWKKGAGIDAWHNPNPTPYTTQKRIGHTLEDVTAQVIQP